MPDNELIVRVGELRDRGLTPKAIAKTLGLRQSDVAELVRRHAAARPVAAGADVASAWLSIGWSGGLSWEGHDDWRDAEHMGAVGLVGVLVARAQRYDKLSVCGCLVDTHCLGVKNAIPARVMDHVELTTFRQYYFSRFRSGSIAVPFELAQHLVLGAVDFARSLGFEPHEDFAACRKHLGEWAGGSAIRFGNEGRPSYVTGPHDDVDHILRTLNARVGRGNFDFVDLG
jgi:hypothetical protein